MPGLIQKIVRELTRPFRPRVNKDNDEVLDYLKSCRGVIHIGANKGQERHFYHSLGLNVLWVEPIPDVFARLCKNIARYPQQQALEALLLDQDGQDVTLHIASNGGASSSVFAFNQQEGFLSDLTFTHDIKLKTKTLTSLVKENHVDLATYDALVLDTQGSELLILQGGKDLLGKFRFIQVEATETEVYNGAAKASEITSFLDGIGFDCFKSGSPRTDHGLVVDWEVVFRNRHLS